MRSDVIAKASYKRIFRVVSWFVAEMRTVEFKGMNADENELVTTDRSTGMSLI